MGVIVFGYPWIGSIAISTIGLQQFVSILATGSTIPSSGHIYFGQIMSIDVTVPEPCLSLLIFLLCR